MKKMLALCMAMLLSLAMLAGCSSADPTHPYRRLSLVVAEREMRFIGSCSEKTFRSMPAFYKKMIWIIRLQKHSPQKLLQRKRLNPLENLLFKKQVRYYNIVSE